MLEMENFNTPQKQQLNIGAVSRQYITLKRYDLLEWKKDTPIKNLTIYDFKSTSVTRDEILSAYYILFSDYNIHKVLKDRFI
jgi:hypothetical protein